MSSVPIEEGAIDWEQVRTVIVQLRSKMQMLIDTDAQENAERDEQRGLFIEEAKKYEGIAWIFRQNRRRLENSDSVR